MTFPKPTASVRSPLSGHTLNVALNVAGIALPVLAGVLTVPALVRHLGQERFATLALGWTIVGYFSVLDLGLGRALTMHIARYSRAHEIPAMAALAGIGRRMMLALGAIWMLLLLALFPIVARHWPLLATQASSPVTAWAMLVLCVPATLWFNSSTSVLEAQSRFVNANVIRIPLGIATYLGPLITSIFVQDIGWIFASLLLARVAGAAVLAWQVRDQYLPYGGTVAPSDLRSLLRFGGWMSVSQIVGPVLAYFDRFAIAAVISAAAVTHYTIPFDVLTRLPLFAIAIMAVLFPIFVQANGAEDMTATREAHLTAKRTLELLLAIWIPATALAGFLGPILLRAWIGGEMAAASAPVWQWLIVGVAVNGLAHLPLTLLQSKGRTDIVAVLHLLELLPYAVGLWWALENHGIAGAAMAWSARVTVDAMLLHLCARKLAPRWGSLLHRSMAAMILMLILLGGLAWTRA